MKRPTVPQVLDESEFDLRARAELALAFEAADPPARLFREAPRWLARSRVRRLALCLLLVGAGTGTVLAMRPPELVRDAIEHEYFERTLRGNFMEPAALMPHLGLDARQAVPGFPQLMRPCDIDGHLAYHLTTFFEKGGIVTVFAFDQPITLQEGHGWWGNVYWQVVALRDGRPLVLVAQKKQALAVAHSQLLKPPD